jgi:hypothetical protein
MAQKDDPWKGMGRRARRLPDHPRDPATDSPASS